jgi:hypothetical protein
VIVARSADGQEPARRFEAALLEQLGRAGVRAIVVPHLYYLSPAHPAAVRLAEISGPVLVAAWLKPRAARWVLAALGCPSEDVVALNLADGKTPEACAEVLCDAVFARPGKTGRGTHNLAGTVAGHEETAAPVGPRWYPVIDYDRCGNCKQCVDFCLFGVYAVDDGGAVRVRQPDNCKDGCPACSRVCPASAIMFPHYADEATISGGDGLLARQDKPSDPGAAAAGPRDELDAMIDELDALDDS